jgi:5-methylcytosine-specific restriction protein A
MPWAPEKRCYEPGCALVALPGKPRCPAHQRAYYRQDNASRDPALTAFYNSTEWKGFRAAYRAEHPWCQTCEREGRETLAQQVDHLIPVRQRPDLALDEGNVQSLCASCHSRRTRLAERRGAPWRRPR